ncbi:Spherulation-specific family 4-domain-containing protein [Aspergillus leporis]|uniref:Spherulation-specific family 4-domain-containing protein n=1 Tax=Aspergillus leporis TaxID=41062 RepID=A0A5N5WHG4_9EURO|nr:Spherulation-specific family 4-domain-containing protein [Aspergillus leporis]
MVLPAALATFFILLRCTSAEPPADFLGDETPYRVIPTGTDAPDTTGTASPNNIRGTPNPRVDDLWIDVKVGPTGEKFVRYSAYGTLATKILARWHRGGNRGSVGYWVQRNSENLAYYALAKYMMSKNGNVYPHLPVVTNELFRAPFPTPEPGLLAMFVTDSSDFYLNTTDDLTAWDSSVGEHYPGCSDNPNESENSSPLTIDGFAPDSEYPDDYISQVSTWIEALGSSDEGSDSGSGGDAGQQIAIASYINPLGDPASWERLLAYDSKKVSVLVANVLNGPDYVVDNSWKSVIEQAASLKDLADWASQIEQDIDKWFELYGSSLGGIFFDEGWPECGPNNIYADLYAYINKYTKNKHPSAFTVLNPGSPIAQCFENTMDTLLTFKSSYETYISSYDQIATITALASSRHAGLLEITDDDQPNPYDNLPSEEAGNIKINTQPKHVVLTRQSIKKGLPRPQEPLWRSQTPIVVAYRARRGGCP